MAILIRTLLILLALTGAVLTGCTPASTREALARADSIMVAAPDSALAILDALDPATLNSAGKRARYALLRSQATHKAYLPLDNDSLIGLSVDYYTSSGDKVSLIKSLYYQGVTYSTLGNYEKAVKSAMHSRELARSIHADEWHARASELLADIMNHAYMWDEAVRYSSEAVRHYALAGKERNHLFALCDLALYHGNKKSLSEIQHGVMLLDSVLGIAQSTPADSGLMAYCYRALMPLYVRTDDITHANEAFDSIQSLIPQHVMPIDLSAKASIMMLENDFGGALEYLTLADSLSENAADSISVLSTYIDYYEKTGNLTMANRCAEKMMDIQNRKVLHILEQPVTGAQRDYYHEKSLQEARRSELLGHYMLIGIIVVALTGVASIIAYRQRIHLKNMQIEVRDNEIFDLAGQVKEYINKTRLTDSALSDRNAEIASLRQTNSYITSELDRRNEEISRLKDDASVMATVLDEQKKELTRVNAEWPDIDSLNRTIETLMRGRWETLNMLCDEYFEKGDNDVTRPTILKDIETEISKMRSPKNIRNIEKEVNLYAGGIVERLRAQCPWLKSDDITFIMLIYAGFSPRTICLFTGIKIKYFYGKRSRLTERIMASDAKEKELFCSKMR